MQQCRLVTLANERSKSDERRREPRIEADHPASIQILSPLEPARFNVRVLDISRNGLKITTPKLLESRTVLQVRLGEMFIMGEVRYCTQAEGGFHAGLHIQDALLQAGSDLV